jgi:hypothetical protein
MSERSYRHLKLNTKLCALITSQIASFTNCKRKAIPVTGRGGPYGCETSRLPHFIDNRFADVGEIASLTRRMPFYPPEDSWYSFLLKNESPQGHSAAGRIRPIEKFNYLIGNQTRKLPTCSTMPQPTTLSCAPLQQLYASLKQKILV